MPEFPAPRPDRIALYAHIPFCVRKCPYCAFISQELRDPQFAGAVVDRLLVEARHYRQQQPWSNVSAHSLYLGGGTPSMLPAGDMRRLLTGLRSVFPFTRDAEVTVELNPGTLRDDLIEAWIAGGVTRISFGVQSLGEHTLARLGRIHDAESARRTFAQLKQAAHFQLNADLMYGVAAERAMEEWRETVDEVAGWGLDHLSAYMLIVEEGTPFAAMQERGRAVKLDEDLELEQAETLRAAMAQAGFDHYEVSNWARPERRSRHNISYWDGGSYLSLGPAAHSYDATRRRRFWNLEDSREWMDAVDRRGRGVSGEERLTPREHLEERIMLTLRMVEGGPEAELAGTAERAGLAWPPDGISELEERGLLLRDGGRLCCTEEGLLLVDDIQARLAAGLRSA